MHLIRVRTHLLRMHVGIGVVILLIRMSRIGLRLLHHFRVI